MVSLTIYQKKKKTCEKARKIVAINRSKKQDFFQKNKINRSKRLDFGDLMHEPHMILQFLFNTFSSYWA